jgi:hypothetical protein
MKGNKTKIFALIVFVTGASILVGISVHKMQPGQTLPEELSPTQAPPTWTPAPTSSPSSTATLEKYFGNSSCSLPCWQGIMPGVTTSTQALQRLKDSPLIFNNSIQSEGSMTGSGKTTWRWKPDDKMPEVKGNFEWVNGIVHLMKLTTYNIISIGEIISRFGPPEKISVIDCTEVVEGPQWWCATLYYVKIGFEIHNSWSRSGNEKVIQITSTDITEFIMLFEPSTIEERVSSQGLDSHYLNLQDWKGYGNLLDLYVQ